MEERSKVHVGLDVHKDSISVGVAAPGREPGRMVSKVPHDVGRLTKLLAKVGVPEELHLVYEAGPTRFGLQRKLAALGYACEVIAPSLMPRRPGDRVKTDSRDCIQLAQCSRAGELRAVWVPDPGDEAIRDLSRAREDAGPAPAQGLPAASRRAIQRQNVEVSRALSLAGHAELRRWPRPDGLHRIHAVRAGQ